MEVVISSAIMLGPDQIDDALIRVKTEVEDLKEPVFANVLYDTIFNDKVEKALADPKLSGSIEEYAIRYNELLDKSVFFKKGTFDYYNAAQIAKSLSDNGFFSAAHSVNLRSSEENREINSKEDLEKLIASEKEDILSDPELRARFDRVAKLVQKNRELREFFSYIQENEDILSRLNNPGQLKQDIVKSYLKENETQYEAWLEKHESARRHRKEIEVEAEKQRTQWENVVEIFNSRFFVPFQLVPKNKADVLLGRSPIIDLGFRYIDGEDSANLDRAQLLNALSTGERRALYIFNVIFEIQSRIKDGQATLLIVDDIADSFDYRNKYAIIEYLKEIAENNLFKVILLTHNFDFFRTVEGGFVGYSGCFMASKGREKVSISPASGIKNVFANDWRVNFYKDTAKKVASVAFLRNLVEMSKGESDKNYLKLTSLLHIKADTFTIKVSDVDSIFFEICSNKGNSNNGDKLFIDLIFDEADKCVESDHALALKSKVVLAIAIRLHAELFYEGSPRKFN